MCAGRKGPCCACRMEKTACPASVNAQAHHAFDGAPTLHSMQAPSLLQPVSLQFSIEVQGVHVFPSSAFLK